MEPIVELSVGLRTLPDEYLAALGRICVSFTNLEDALRSCLFGLLYPRSNVMIGTGATAELHFLDLVKQLRIAYPLVYYSDARHKDRRQVKAFDDLLVEASTLAEERNRIIHCVWAGDREGKLVFRFKVRGRAGKGIEFQAEELSVGGLMGTAWKLDRASREIVRRFNMTHNSNRITKFAIDRRTRKKRSSQPRRRA